MQMFDKIFRRYSSISRQAKNRAFFEMMRPAGCDTFLDVGGNLGEGFLEVRDFFSRTIVVDLDRNAMKRLVLVDNTKAIYIPVVANGCCLPFKDKSIDYVFSNAVIEHIPKDLRFSFAQEAKRVARKGYFITTPNFWFPYEPHYKMPFWQFLPHVFKRFVSRFCRVGHFGKGKYERIELLSKRDLRTLFPYGRVAGIKSSQPIMCETIYAWWKSK